MDEIYDLLIIGGGINGAGIARDAAGRGLRVLLVEKDDLAQHTSSASSKLIHGGLRYLEHYKFRLVAEALAEREVLLGIAPHIVRPLEFVMPQVPELRPAWMIRAGLFLYDHLGGRSKLPGSRAVRLDRTPYGVSLRPELTRGFIYADCRVDDARLVVLNAISARELGATVRTRTACIGAQRHRDRWEVQLRDAHGGTSIARARALVNAAGPWVRDVLTEQLGQPSPANVKLIKGSHIVVPRLYPGEHAFLLQNDDRRVVFLIPFESDYTLIGTTDIDIDAHPDAVNITAAETDYLCAAANRYLLLPVRPADVVWSYSGVRPLYDDGERDPSAITRDYTLVYDDAGGAPLLSVFGGKITTYRRLAEHALTHFADSLPAAGGAWTGTRPLPGGNLPDGGLEAYENAHLRHDLPWLAPSLRHALASRHGVNVYKLLGKAASMGDVGTHFGGTLYAAEVDYLLREEWALTADDVLWRRTKCGLHLTRAQRLEVDRYIAAQRE
jgi:glycerol-3-phosphate dehydrogenase